MKPAKILKSKLEKSEAILGVLISQHLWTELIEVAINSGLDYVIVDTEHFSHDHQLIADACRLGRMADFPVLLRPPTADFNSVRIAMDLGPCGLLLPMVETVGQLDAVRDGVYMPPRGRRRPGGPGNEWVSQYGYDHFKTQVEDDLIILPQIESPLGVENVQAIAEHELTTALAIGPFDLSAHLGVCGTPDHPKLLQVLQTIRQAAHKVGKLTWMIGDGQKLKERGFRFFCIAEPTYLLKTTLTGMVARLHGNGKNT